jgi:hypothetical protein
MRLLRGLPCPALVLSGIALAVALGGTSYAAIVLPANSVGTKQLRNGAVVAAKVKPHSLLRSSFAAGQVPAGPPGAQGLPGPAGPQGAKGDAAAKFFATVRRKAGGGIELGPSSGVVTLTAQGNDSGRYDLAFSQDVSKCAVVAMPGGNTLEEAGVTARTSGGANVSVETFDTTTGDTFDLDSFTVAVLC